MYYVLSQVGSDLNFILPLLYSYLDRHLDRHLDRRLDQLFASSLYRNLIRYTTIR